MADGSLIETDNAFDGFLGQFIVLTHSSH